MARVVVIKEQLGRLKQFVVAWQALDLVKAIEALGAFLAAADLLIEEVADQRAELETLRVRITLLEAAREQDGAP